MRLNLAAKKLTKEEKKVAAEAKKVELAKKKAAKQAELEFMYPGKYGKTAAAADDAEEAEDGAAAVSETAKPAKAKGKAKKGKADEAELGDAIGQDIDEGTLKHAVCTAVLASRKDSKDVKIESFSISLFGKQLFEDQKFELTFGHRYGLIAQNGAGKTTLLKCIAARQIPIPDFIDIWYLDKEAEPESRSAVDCVIDTVKLEKERLEALEEDIMSTTGPEDPRLEAVYEKLDKMDPLTFEKRAGELLYGLGFSQTMMKRQTKDMSGGWRMRVALAQALFVKPMLLVLDEPTNHLDLGACVWLEDYLAKWDSCLIITSHSADFLNGVCSKTYHLTVKKTLELYGGNFSNYVQTRKENEVNQQKMHEKEQFDIKHLKEFISSCGTCARKPQMSPPLHCAS